MGLLKPALGWVEQKCIKTKICKTSVFHKNIPDDDMPMVKGVGTIPRTPEEIIAVISNLSHKVKYDDTIDIGHCSEKNCDYRKGWQKYNRAKPTIAGNNVSCPGHPGKRWISYSRLVKQLDPNHAVVQYTILPRRGFGARDFVVITTKFKVRVGDQDKYLIVTQSVVHPECPVRKNTVRAKAKLGGWLLEPQSDGTTKCTTMNHLDMKPAWGTGWAVNKAVKGAIPKAISNIRAYLEGRRPDGSKLARRDRIIPEELERQAAQIRKETRYTQCGVCKGKCPTCERQCDQAGRCACAPRDRCRACEGTGRATMSCS